MNEIFKQAFEKNANAQVLYNPSKNQQPQPVAPAPTSNPDQENVFTRGFKKALPILGTAAVVGAGIYGGLRRGGFKKLTKAQEVGRKHGLTKVIAKNKPKSAKELRNDRITHGADKIEYSPSSKDSYHFPSKPKKVKGRVLHEQAEGAQFIQGKHDVGSMANKGVKEIEGNKKLEMKLLKKMDPKSMPKTTLTSKAHKGKKGLAKLDKSFKGDNYYIKPNDGWGSGQGGVGFIQKDDVTKYLSGKKMDADKVKKIKAFMKDPKKFTAQADMKIEKDITGQLKEFRVHGFGNKVVPGASSPRGKNILGAGGKEQKEAERHLQKALRKLPKKYREAALAADVVKTKTGYKIVELNAGTAASGLLDPAFIKKHHGFFASLEAVRKNQKVYKELTGRASKLEAGIKGTAGAAATGLSGAAYLGSKEKIDKKRAQ